MAPIPIDTFVETFFDREKADARQLIRHEMESMLDPLVESLFGLLKAKFVDYLDAARSNVQLEPQQNDDSNNSSSSSTHESFPQPMNPSTSTDESSNSETEQQQENSNIEDNQHEYDDNDEDDCDCDECVYGMIDLKEDDDDDDEDEEDDAQLIDEHYHESSPLVKRPRMDPTQSQVIGSRDPREGTNEDNQANQVHNHDKPLVVILAIECTELCRSIFVKNHDYPLIDQLKDHMWNEHSIRQFRCLVKDCTESFDNRKSLRSHINQAHPNTSQWHCDKCPEYLTSYKLLTSHKNESHQHGLFQCSYPYCPFSGECRKKIYDHYTETHKPDLVCDQCDYRTKESTLFKEHERAHLGIEPYRCKWPDCQYSNASRNTAMMHIENVHFISKTSQELTYLGEPKDFLEVVQ